MTSKNLFFKLSLENMKRRVWTLALGFLVFFFTFPVTMTFNFSREFSGANGTDAVLRRQNAAINLIGMENGFLVIVVLTAALICGVSGFAYLHSRKKVDFYHSIPVRRETLFWVSYINGMIIMAAVYFINLLLAMAVMLANGMAPGQFLGEAMKAFGFHMLYYCLMYTTAVAAMMLTGHIIIGIVMNLVLNVWGPAVMALLQGCFMNYFRSYYNSSDSIFERLLVKASPFALYMQGFAEANLLHPQLAPHLAAAAAVAAVLAVAALFLYKKRPSEAAGRAMAFRASQAPVKILLVVPMAVCSGLFFHGLGESDGWLVFGLACGVLISHGIIEIIYHFEFRRLFSNLKQMGICAVLAAAVMAVFCFDLTGYDTYLPEASRVESAAVSINGVDDWIDYREPRLEKNEYGDALYLSYDYSGAAEYQFEHMAMTNVEDVLALAKKGIERNEELRAGTALEGPEAEVVQLADAAEEESFRSVYIMYRLKNGKTVKRAYYISLNQNRDIIDRIVQDAQYQTGTFPLLGDLGKEVTGINYRSLGNDLSPVMAGDREFTDRFLETYVREFTALTPDVRRAEAPVGILSFKTAEIQDMIDQMKASVRYFNWTELNYMNEYPVYPSFTDTLVLLEQAGISLERGFDTEEISYAAVGDEYQEQQREKEGRLDEKPYRMIVNDEARIEELLEYAICEEYENLNPLYFRGNGAVRVRLELKPSEAGPADPSESYIFHVPMELVPDFVTDEIQLVNDVYDCGF